MIQLNLLPDVKQHFIKARRLQRLVISITFIVSASAVGLFVLLFLTVNIWQRARIRGLNSDVSRLSNQLKSTPDLDRILTVQQQLRSLPQLHDEKPAAKRLFGYISQFTPQEVKISKFKIDFTNNSFDITGSADKLESVNKFADTLKFTKYKLTADAAEKPAFTNVVLKTFSRDDKTANYEITVSFATDIFDSRAPSVQLVVPQNFITTRSETERPQALFETPPQNNTPGAP